MHIHFFISLRQVDMRSYANKRSVHACRTIYLLGPPGTYTPRIRSYPGDHARMPSGWVIRLAARYASGRVGVNTFKDLRMHD